MTTIRVFPQRTALTPRDELAFVGDPPMAEFRPAADRIDISVTFTWDIDEGHRLWAAWSQHYPSVWMGGPAFGASGDDFVPGRYVRSGVTFTSHGCNNNCPWCLVPKLEGRLVETENFVSGRTVNDNNLLQCSRRHRDAVFQMLAHEAMIYLSGGLDARLVTTEVADQIRALRIRELYLACDTDAGIAPLRRAVRRLSGFRRRQLRCYVLLAYDGDTISKAEERLEKIWAAGCLPYAQLYQPPELKKREYSGEWSRLRRKWCRPAAMAATHQVIS